MNPVSGTAALRCWFLVLSVTSIRQTAGNPMEWISLLCPGGVHYQIASGPAISLTTQLSIMLHNSLPVL